MNLELLLVTLIPLVIFVIIEIKFSLRAGIWAAIGTALAGVLYFYIKLGEIDSMLISEVVLIVILGLISMKMASAKFFKLQPFVMAIALCAYVLYNQWTGTPVLVKMLDLMDKIDPKLSGIYSSDAGRELLERLSGHLVYLFASHGVLVLWGAYRLKSFGWLMTRIAFYPMAFVFMIAEMIMNADIIAQLQNSLS